MRRTNLGRVRPVLKGAHDSTRTYESLDIVTASGSSYIAILPVPVGIAISNDEYWELLAQKGAQGQQGAQGEQGPKGDTGATGATGAAGQDGEDGVGIASAVLNADYTLTIAFTDGTSYTTPSIRGETGQKGDTGGQGPQGPQGLQGIQGPQGIQGVPGKDFSIYKTYSSIADMEADAQNVEEGSFVLIATSVELEDNAKLFVKDALGFTFLTDLSGAQGIKGEQGAQGPQGNQGPQGPKGDTGETGPKGDTGDTGPKGNGISSLVLYSSAGLVKTYRMTFTNGEHFDFNVYDGATGATGQTGPQGERGPQGAQGEQGPKGDTGATGATGAAGTDGDDATINGVNALTLTVGDGLSGTMSGSTYTLSLDLDNYDGEAM